jgi:CheY-specific phosphatase CheX
VIRCTTEVEGGWVRLSIADDGSGIDVAALRQRITDAGLRLPDELAAMSDEAVMMLVFADNVSTRAEVSELAGRGVGLAAVMAAIAAIDGTASVTSIPGQGTTFHFSWPLEEAGERQADPAAVVASVVARTREHVFDELGVEVEAVESYQGDPNQIELRAMTAIIEMGAPVSLLIAFSFEDSLVTAFYDRMTAGMSVPDAEKEALRLSVIGEVVNTILGHCTADFSSSQEVSLTPPVVLQRRKSLRRMKDAVFVGRSLKTDYGCVDINLVGPCTLFDSKLDYVE